MDLTKIFDKFDDIIYKPVEVICDWINEPLKKSAAKREEAAKQHTADIESAARQQIADNERKKAIELHNQQLELNQQKAIIDEKNKRLDIQLKKEELENRNAALKEEAEINAEIRKTNAEIDQMINEQEDARRDKLVESIKRYQIDLAKASCEIVNSIGVMSLELREKANNMVIEKTKVYKAMQEDAIEQSQNRLLEIDEKFANNERVRIMMEDRVINQMDSIVDMAGRFILELSEDIKRLNANTDELMKMGMDNVSSYLKPMADALKIGEYNSSYSMNKIEDNSIIKSDVIEV